MRRVLILQVALPIALCLSLDGAHAQAKMQLEGIGYSPGKSYDQQSWTVFVEAFRPGSTGLPAFECWATDAQTYETVPPYWPTCPPTDSRFQSSRLLSAHLPSGLRTPTDSGLPPCTPPNQNNPAGQSQIVNFAAGNFPASGCIAEEVRRNRPAFDYIVDNNLYTQSGLIAAYERWTNSGYSKASAINFPSTSIALKMDWVPVATLITWLKNNGVTLDAAEVKKEYYVVEDCHKLYALVGLHMSSKQYQGKILPNWLWADFEHRRNPGRCDTMGCYDQFGTAKSTVSPAATANGQYGECQKSPELEAMFKKVGMSSVWNNYCLKATQVDYVTETGQPILLGNSVIERLLAGVPISTSSCISCHTNAAFSSSGVPNPAVQESPIGNVTVSTGYMPYDFLWGLINIP